jgi:hypothetical protein
MGRATLLNNFDDRGIFAAIRRARPASRLSRVVFTLSPRVSKCLLRAKHSIQWFSHGSFVLRPHFLRHWAVQVLQSPEMAKLG